MVNDSFSCTVILEALGPHIHTYIRTFFLYLEILSDLITSFGMLSTGIICVPNEIQIPALKVSLKCALGTFSVKSAL